MYFLQVMIEGIVGWKDISDIAIDDVSFIRGPCRHIGKMLLSLILY